MAQVIITTNGRPGMWQQPYYNQQPVQATVIRQPRPGYFDLDEEFKSSAAKGLGVTQCVCGILGVLLAILQIFSCSWNAYGGMGIWCGGFMIICGGLSIGAAKQQARSLIIACFVFSLLLCVVFSFAMFVAGAVALSYDSLVIWSSFVWVSSKASCSQLGSTSKVWDAFLMLAGLLSWVCAFAQSIICCMSRAICGSSNEVGVVAYTLKT